ncbi:MAG TPA: glycosyltransferase [Candidatus Acidoferrales bacterium]|nr:glycosyltransferase [Candidatus Acidoferrales bacterium]
MTPLLSVILPTRNRANLLPAALRSLEVAAEACSQVEIIVIDNGSTDETPAIIDAWAKGGTQRVVLKVAEPGQSRAINAGFAAAQAPVLALTDDDIVVTPHWLRCIVDFFAAHPEYSAAMGPVRVPREVTDPALIQRIAWYGTLPFFDAGEQVRDLDEMYGCNMLLRRTAVDQVGGFNERLGPGTSGFGGDTDMSFRIRRAGLRIGYIPDAVIYHAVEGSRLTPEFFRRYHHQKARSVFLMDAGLTRQNNLGRCIEAAFGYVWARLTRNLRRQLRAEAKLIRHIEFWRLNRRGYG